MRLLAASLSGQSDADWAQEASDYVDGAILGGVAIDEEARTAARQIVRDRDREEFLPQEPLEFVEEQLKKLAQIPIVSGMNVRSTSIDPLLDVANVCANHDAVIEINAHCRQPELKAASCGESLLKDTDRLTTFVETAASTGAIVSVKVRAEVPEIDLVETAGKIETAGADIIHIGAMDSEHVVGNVTTETEIFVIANNGVRNLESVREYFEYGADAVSVGRPSDNLRVLRRVRDAVDEWAQRDY